ncbi:unnamed protein product, partial [Effrenium voratum]
MSPRPSEKVESSGSLDGSFSSDEESAVPANKTVSKMVRAELVLELQSLADKDLQGMVVHVLRHMLNQHVLDACKPVAMLLALLLLYIQQPWIFLLVNQHVLEACKPLATLSQHVCVCVC